MHCMLGPGQSPHGFTLTAADMEELARARLVVAVGLGVDEWASSATARAEARGAALVEMYAAYMRHGISQREGSRGARRGPVDPHVWLDPRNAAAITRIMVAVLADADPANAALYRDNGSKLLAGLVKLEAEIRQTLEPVTGVPFLVFHDAFGYFEDRFGLASAGAVTVSPDRPPGAKRISALRRLIRTEKIPCVFTEPEFEPALARTLIEGSKARIGILDPLGAGLTPGPGLYGELMEGLARSFAGCLKSRL